MKPITHGGTRPNAGRPAGEPTVVIGFRVPKKKARKIKEEVKLFIKNTVF
jgi:hypothetical protein